ncbi:MAG: hypothetical protein ACPGU4_03045 [Flavobacteriales bacterium]
MKSFWINLFSILCAVFIVSNTSTAQENNSASKKDSTQKPVDVTISIGGGAVHFLGDVEDAKNQPTVQIIGNRTAFDFSFGIGLSKSFTANLNLIYGRLSGNENTFESHRNFDSKMFQGGINFEYNFGNFYKTKIPVINPFINAGVYYSSYFNISTDLRSEDGTYFYWSDGRIRDQEETGDPLLDETASNISRDFTYETFLPKRSIHSGSVSGGLGFDLHLAHPFTVRIMSKYFHSFTDGIDGVDDGSLAEAKDGFFFTTLSLMIHPMGFLKKDKRPDPKYKYIINMDELDNDDTDEDGVYDLSDLCAATPKGVKVDKTGCPLDDDKDGIPNYRDKGADSPSDLIVDQNGVPINYRLIAERWSDSPNVYGITWDKDYDNPRFTEDEGYTVNVDIEDGEENSKSRERVLQIPELRKEVVNDSIIIYRLGVYEKYADVEKKKDELHQDGIYLAYTVPESSSIEAAKKYLDGVDYEPKSTESFGIKESITRIKTSEAYGQPQLEFAISRFERYLYDGQSEAEIATPYFNAISAFDSDKIVGEERDLLAIRLNKKKAEGTANAETQEPKLKEPIPATKAEVAREKENKKPQEAVEEIADSQPTIEKFKEAEKALEKEPKVVQHAEQKPASEEAIKTNTDVKSASLSNEALSAAIDEIRSTSKLNTQPRINYAPVKPRFKAADANGDQLISAEEVQAVLDNILKGDSDFTEYQFNEMNTYFTDFTKNVEPINFGGTKVAFVNGTLTILKTEGGEYKPESRRLLAKKYKEADFNGDGELMPEEVQQMIGLFMKGGSSYSHEKLHELIDLYFD